MILTVDIGNTNIMLGGFREEEPLFVARIHADTAKTEDEYASLLQNVLALHQVNVAAVSGAIISSVVPQLTTAVKRAVAFLCGTEPLVVGPGIKTGLNIHCDVPSSVGADLICASVAANRYYGAPALVVDMGTATKMIAIDPSGAFAGVSIIPGVMMGLTALAENTAQLPMVSLEAPSSAIGKNTVDCIKSGVIFGSAATVDGMIDRICEEMGGSVRVVATGGLASAIIPHCRHGIVTDDNLVLKGLYLLYVKNTKTKN